MEKGEIGPTREKSTDFLILIQGNIKRHKKKLALRKIKTPAVTISHYRFSIRHNKVSSFCCGKRQFQQNSGKPSGSSGFTNTVYWRWRKIPPTCLSQSKLSQWALGWIWIWFRWELNRSALHHWFCSIPFWSYSSHWSGSLLSVRRGWESAPNLQIWDHGSQGGFNLCA